MSQEKVVQVLNDLAADVVMLEPGDLAGLGQLLNGLDELEKPEVCLGLDYLHPLAEKLRDAVVGIIYDEFAESEKSILLLSSLITEMQDALRNGGTSSVAPELAPDLPETAFGPENDETTVVEAVLCATPVDEIGTDMSAVESTAALAVESQEEDREENPEEDLAVDEELFAGVDFSQDEDLYQGFIAESNEHLDTIEENILSLEQDPENLEILNSIFRPFHTIKGVSGFMNLKQMNVIAHHLENLLDDARNKKFYLDGAATDLILDGVDFLKQMLLQLNHAICGGQPEPMPVQSFLNRIDTLHQVLLGVEPAQAAAAVFSESYAEDEVDDLQPPPKIGEILVREGAISPADLEDALTEQKTSAGIHPEQGPRKIGKILVELKKTDIKTVARAIRQQQQPQPKESSGGGSAIKVDTEKLDNLVDMVGELVIVQAMLKQDPDISALTTRKVAENMAQLSRITSSLQKVAMSLRMVPIKQTFGKMVRLVRDLAKKTEKEIELVMSGEETEIDRNMVDLIYDPMVHMIRNSADHGIEKPEERRAAGKNQVGTITLKAFHGGGNVIIEIVDDGRGLNVEKIRKKALERGMINEHDQPSDQELFNMILAPGFSTADKITDVSGRGVGMDVVKKAIEKLRGVVEVDSTPGQGSVVTIKVPLTLAIIDGMVVIVGRERYIIPTLNVVESLRPLPEQYHTVQGQGELIRVRDRLLPLVRLHQVFKCEAQTTEPWQALVVVVEHESEQFCLLVDKLVGKQEIVIKSLGERLKDLPGIAGGAIMGDGRVGLILDVAGLVRR
ncbi:MAG: chemotaxis protein CheA [Deltaproteobacteria bacterium]|nr:chemotaxis protein CheA [Deltaproteobacteria bacterium]